MESKSNEKPKEKTRHSSWKIPYTRAFPKLYGSIEADVLIVGGGLAGIWNAYMLAKEGLKVVVLEKREQILENTTFFTTAFITEEIDTDFRTLEKMFGREKARLAWQAGHDAIELIKKTVEENNIDCEFKTVPSITYAKDEKEFEDLREEYEALRAAGIEAALVKRMDLGFRHSGILEIPDQAMYHPIKFGRALADLALSLGARIYTDSKVVGIDDATLTAKTEAGEVKAKNIIIATYRPILHQGTHFKKGLYDSYVFELHIPKGLIKEGMYMDLHNPYHYFRVDSYRGHDRMIVGGEDHRRELQRLGYEKSFKALEEFVRAIVPHGFYKITRKWSSGVLEPSDGLPLIGRIKQNIFVVSAFSGNGMTYSAISSTIIRDLIFYRENPYIGFYDPLRIPDLKQLILKGKDYTGELLGGIVKNILK